MRNEKNSRIKIVSDAFSAYFEIINRWNHPISASLYEQLKQCFLPIEIQNGRRDEECIRKNYVFYSNNCNEHGQNSTTITLGKYNHKIWKYFCINVWIENKLLSLGERKENGIQVAMKLSDESAIEYMAYLRISTLNI